MNLYVDSFKFDNIPMTILVSENGLAYIGVEKDTQTDPIYTNIILNNNTVLLNDSQKTSQYIGQIKKYLNGHLSKYNLPFDYLNATNFQINIWNKLQDIPYGTTKNYQDIAIEIGKPSASRAVANAIGKNPYLIVVPCHRVIRKDGSLGGFRAGVDIKKDLLNYEANICLSNEH